MTSHTTPAPWAVEGPQAVQTDSTPTPGFPRNPSLAPLPLLFTVAVAAARSRCSTFTVLCQEGKGTWATSQPQPIPGRQITRQHAAHPRMPHPTGYDRRIIPTKECTQARGPFDGKSARGVRCVEGAPNLAVIGMTARGVGVTARGAGLLRSQAVGQAFHPQPQNRNPPFLPFGADLVGAAGAVGQKNGDCGAWNGLNGGSLA